MDILRLGKTALVSMEGKQNEENDMDNHKRLVDMQRDQAEIYSAVMQLREGDITFTDFYDFCKSFKADITVDQLVKSLDGQLGGVRL